jgi:flagellar hook-basal body complex protein FliE
MKVDSKDIRANQAKHLNKASGGEEVISTPENSKMTQAEFENKLLGALKEVDDHLSCAKKMLSWEEARNEL